MSAFSPAALDLAHREDLRWLAALMADVRRAVIAVERLDGTIACSPGGEVVMGVLGYSEASATATRVALPRAETVRVSRRTEAKEARASGSAILTAYR